MHASVSRTKEHSCDLKENVVPPDNVNVRSLSQALDQENQGWERQAKKRNLPLFSGVLQAFAHQRLDQLESGHSAHTLIAHVLEG